LKILITGSSGFIGKYLTKYLASNNISVLGLSRSGKYVQGASRSLKWSLGDDIPITILGDIDCVIHLAHDFKNRKSSEFSASATISLIEKLNKFGIKKQIFLSSFSAGPWAQSNYGISKFRIEKSIKKFNRIIIVRPGLVIGNGGVFKKIKKIARLLPVIPLPDGGKGIVSIVKIENLSEFILKIIKYNAQSNNLNYLIEDERKTLKDIVIEQIKHRSPRPLIFFIPNFVILTVFKLVNFFNFNSLGLIDSLIGHISSQKSK